MITQEDFDIASGAKALDSVQAKIYYNNLEAASENIQAAFKKQMENAMVCLCFGFRTVTKISYLQKPWDQDRFEQLLTEWVVACDQPFEEVDWPELRELLTYTHHPSPHLSIPY